MRVISPVSLPTYLSVVYRNNMSAVPASIHLKTNVDRIYLLLLKTVLSFPSLLSKTMSIFQDFFKTFLQFSQIQDYFQDLNEFINFKTFSSLEENVRTMHKKYRFFKNDKRPFTRVTKIILSNFVKYIEKRVMKFEKHFNRQLKN